MQDVKLAEHCVTQLEKVLAVELEFELCSDEQFVRIFKIIVEQYIVKIRKDDKSLLRNYILEVCDIFTTSIEDSGPTYSQSIVFFKTLIMEGKFLETLQSYINDSR